jgi:hypothetical protein
MRLDLERWLVETQNRNAMKRTEDENYLAQLRAAIQQLHGCPSEHVETVEVKEVFRDRVVWEGQVEVFRMMDHPKAKVCYAWRYTDKGTNTERIAAIPGLRLISSAADAVRTFILAENQKHSR